MGENDELHLNLKTARKEIINLQTQIATNSNSKSNQFLSDHSWNGITPDLQSKISRLSAENKRLKAMNASKQSMEQLMDDLDVKSRLLKNTEIKYQQTQKTLDAVNEELSNNKKIAAEWMRNSCSPQQYQNMLQQVQHLENEKKLHLENIEQLKLEIHQFREKQIASTSKIKQYEGELNRTKQRYRDLFEYTEQQKMRLSEYKKAIAEYNSFESNQKQKSFQTEKYFKENEELKQKIKIINQEMKCVQNACYNLLKRQVLLNNNMLSAKPKNNNTSPLNIGNNTNSQIQRPSTFSFRK